ncbi:GNAT family N-acetyltransferase [Nocardioides sp.]|uniref:GNAT family N-acetyltransferase n=1 Tax=Nocardioides sp. TaxID=35761 RepID=UPI00351899E9
MTPFLLHDLGDGAALGLRDLATVRPVHELTLRNLDRLRRWEGWAHGEQTIEGGRAFTRVGVQDWIDGRRLPLVILQDGVIVGAIGATLDRLLGTAAIGYWIDADAEGRGLVTRAAHRVLDRLRPDPEIVRAEIRASVDNRRSRAVAERLGFALEGVLRSATPVGEERHDVAVYGLLLGEEDGRFSRW